VVLHDQSSSVRLIGKADIDALGTSMLAYVGQRLLSGSVNGQLAVASQIALLPIDDHNARNPGIGLELGGESGKPIGARQVIIA
jgi:hypothetical protein